MCSAVNVASAVSSPPAPRAIAPRSSEGPSGASHTTDPDAVETSAEPVGADLRHYRLDPLTERGGAGDHLDPPIAAEDDAHIVERTEPAFLDEKAEPQADHLARLPTTGHVGVGRLDRRDRR